MFCSKLKSTCNLSAIGLPSVLLSGSVLVAAVEYFTPQHQLLGIGAGRAAMTPEVLAARTDRMIQSQTFTIMREPNSGLGAERITGARLAPIFRRAAD